MSIPDSFLEETPLFIIPPPTLGPSKLDGIFENWPKETLEQLKTAQELRDQLMEHMNGRFGNYLRVQDIDKYLSVFVNIEKEKQQNGRIGSSRKYKFSWHQSPFINEKYKDRTFPATYCQNEVLHLIMLRAIVLLNQGYEENNGNHPEAAVTALRQSAGVFQYLSSDKCRNIDSTTVPIEFQDAIFNAFMNLALGQAYAIIAAKGESNGTGKSALAKICYTASTSFQTALDAAKEATPSDVLNEKFICWLEQMAILYHSYSATFFALAQKQKEEDGVAIGLVRLSINDLKKADKLYKNDRINKEIKNLIKKLEPLDKKWSEENFIIACKPIADEKTANRFIATAALSLLNLPQPLPYKTPEASEEDMSTPNPAPQEGEEAPKIVKKIGPAKTDSLYP